MLHEEKVEIKESVMWWKDWDERKCCVKKRWTKQNKWELSKRKLNAEKISENFCKWNSLIKQTITQSDYHTEEILNEAEWDKVLIKLTEFRMSFKTKLKSQISQCTRI